MLARRIRGVRLCCPTPVLLRAPRTTAPPRTAWSAPHLLPGRRLLHTNGPFEPLRPPRPDSLGAPRPASSWPRSSRLLRRTAIASSILAAVLAADHFGNGASLRRTVRTFGTGAIAAMDYKVNFRPVPWTGGTVQDLHERNARRLADLLVANGGLYLKMGQAIAVQGAALPVEFQRMFQRMFDDADADEWADVEAVIREDFGGRSVEDVFGVSFKGEPGKGLFERVPRASASVAQVHWARLPDGREVAVKVQKRNIARQMAWDLWAYRSVMWIYSKWFDLPLYRFTQYISDRLQLETDFVNEAANGKRMRELVAADPRLRDRVYVPTVYDDLTSRRVMTAEWIEGPKLYDKNAMTAPWMGGYGKGSPGLGKGNDLEPPTAEELHQQRQQRQQRQHRHERLKPVRDEWRGPLRKGGLGLSTKEIMSTIVDLFSAQIFVFGEIHCDPHPANIIVRRLPSGRAQVVLIDHGLYVRTTPKFRHQYARLWKALITLNDAEIRAVTALWGIRAPDLFASATMNKPYAGGDGRGGFGGSTNGMTSEEKQFEMQRRMREGIRDVLADENSLPRELLFIGRNLRIVQGLNQRFGSPVNRIRVMGEWASRSLMDVASEDGALPVTINTRAALLWQYALFKFVLALTDLAYWTVRVGAWLGVGGTKGGLDQVMDRRMKSMARDMGVELQEDVSMFDG